MFLSNSAVPVREDMWQPYVALVFLTVLIMVIDGNRAMLQNFIPSFIFRQLMWIRVLIVCRGWHRSRLRKRILKTSGYGKMTGNDNPRKFQCACCTPPRQIFYRTQGNLMSVHHEDDESLAIARDSGKWSRIRAHYLGWYFGKDGTIRCPLHSPEWLLKWRAKYGR